MATFNHNYPLHEFSEAEKFFDTNTIVTLLIEPFHPKGEGNGYIITFGDKRIYVAGGTENTPEMKALKDIAAAFIPMNLPFTMNSTMAADAVKVLIPF